MLLILLFIKHFLLDFPYQTPYMLKKSQTTGWRLPLFSHAAAHAFGTFLVCTFFVPGGFALALALVDLLAHWAIDYWKARKTVALFASPLFWTYLGFDQLLHNLTYILIIFLVSLYTGGF